MSQDVLGEVTMREKSLEDKSTKLKLKGKPGSNSTVKVTVIVSKDGKAEPKSLTKPNLKPQSKPKPKPSSVKPRLQQTATQRNNPLHGITLKTIVTELQQHYGWHGLFEKTRMNCFQNTPTIKSSLTFLRKTDWARDKIEQLYLFTQREIERSRRKN